MNIASSNSTLFAARAVRPAAAGDWRFAPALPAETPAVKDFIRHSFRSAYGAHIPHFLPQLMALHRDGALMAACGLRHAATERLFLEAYLDGAVETILPRGSRAPEDRSRIVQVGNLSVARPGASRHLIGHLTAYLHAAGMTWTVFTAGPALRNGFVRLGIPLYRLASADIARIPAAERSAWGRYYDQRPAVCAVSVHQAQRALAS